MKALLAALYELNPDQPLAVRWNSPLWCIHLFLQILLLQLHPHLPVPVTEVTLLTLYLDMGLAPQRTWHSSLAQLLLAKGQGHVPTAAPEQPQLLPPYQWNCSWERGLGSASQPKEPKRRPKNPPSNLDCQGAVLLCNWAPSLQQSQLHPSPCGCLVSCSALSVSIQSSALV